MGNNIDFAKMASVLAPIVAGKNVVSMGNSMGGFLAIAASIHVPINTCFAFAPQFSVDPAVVPNEPRWMRYRTHIEEYTLPSLAGSFNDTCQYYIFSGATEGEWQHWENFPQANNVHSFILPKSDHHVALDLKEAGQLNDVLGICLNGAPKDAEICAKIGFNLPD